MSGPRHGALPVVGSAMALGAGAVWSFGAILADLASGADAFQYLIWRSVGIVVVVEVIGRFRSRSGGSRPAETLRAFTAGPRMMLATVLLLVASLGFIYAVKTTSPATAAFLASTTPVFAVLGARIFLGEPLRAFTLAVVAVAFAGLVVMVAGDLQAGNLVGNGAALASAMGFAGYTICVRSDPSEDWSPVLPGYGVLLILICGIVTVAGGRALVPPLTDTAYALVHGAVFIVVGTFLYNLASRRVPAAAMAVFAQTEMVLVPIWSFLVLSEVPRATTLLGGVIIMGAILTKAVVDGRGSSRPAGTTRPVAAPADIA